MKAILMKPITMHMTIIFPVLTSLILLAFAAPTILAYLDVNNLTTLQRMRYTAIQMTILSLEPEVSTTLTSDEIAEKIMEYQLLDEKNRLSTEEIEKMYIDIVKENTTIE